jgi:ABC-type transport system involved in cytochrome bd biosynthesis fused ATPase/permease subunit
MDKYKIEKDIIDTIKDTAEEKRKLTIKSMIILTKIMLFASSKVGESILSAGVAVFIIYLFGQFSLLAIGASMILAPITAFLIKKIIPSFDNKDEYEEYKYTLSILRDLREGKIDIE